MTIKTIAPGFSVSPQIQAADMAALRAAGFQAIICNRPDNEDPGQPNFAEIAAAAQAAGLQARHVPVRPDAIGPADVAAFKQALAELPGPVLGYCRSGGRATALWTRAQA